MVHLVHASEKHFGVLDNNFPRSYEWLTPEQFLKSYAGGRTGWSVILLAPPPAPLPFNGGKP
jgi:hypothetical protein